jgi:hypothetical protein
MFGVNRMPWVKISPEAHKAMKQYLVDIEGITLGELVEDALQYAMQNLADFETFIGLEPTEEDDQETETEDQTEDQEDDDSQEPD